jgi:uridine kinase
MNKSSTKVIGICGPSGSGKTTLAEKLCEVFQAVRIELDGYFFLDPPRKKYESRDKNLELPENIDWDALRKTIKSLRKGNKAKVRKINWETEEYVFSTVAPKEIIIVEGFLLFHDQSLQRMFDLSVYLDISDEAGIDRRLGRIGAGKDKQYYREWYEEVTFPEYRKRRSTFEERADLIIDGEAPMRKNVKTVVEHIRDL